jgi:hypothetical protein
MRSAAWQSWLSHLSFILWIQYPILAQTENIFLFCLCHIWIHICRVLTLEQCLLINMYKISQWCWIPLGKLPKKAFTTICLWGGTISKCDFKFYWFNTQCLIKTPIQPSRITLKNGQIMFWEKKHAMIKWKHSEYLVICD